MGRDPVRHHQGQGPWWGQLPPLLWCFPRWGCLQSRVWWALGPVSRVCMCSAPLSLSFLQATRSRGGPGLPGRKWSAGLPPVRGPASLHPLGLKNEKPVAPLPRSPQDCSQLTGDRDGAERDRAVRAPRGCGQVSCRACASAVTVSSPSRTAPTTPWRTDGLGSGLFKKIFKWFLNTVF